MINKNYNMLLRIAQADAYAMATEYIKHPRDDQVLADALKFAGFVKHPTHHLKAGSYTDDTQMSIAVAEVLLSDEPRTRQKFTQAFVNCFCRDPRDGYSRGFQAILEQASKAPSPYHEFMKLVIPNSTKNGGCMRAVPVGVIKDIKEVLEIARVQASVTHNTAEGIWSAQAVALMSHFALYSKDGFDKMGAFLLNEMPKIVTPITIWPNTVREGYVAPTVRVDHWTEWLANGAPWNDKVTNRTYEPLNYYGVGISTVKACYTAITTKSTLKDILEQIIVWGGDTDSVAAIAWGIASTRMQEHLDGFWEYGLEPGARYGVPFLKNLGEQLINKYS
jgi:ADP-ribosyl-[dinitrogen reductase] hydrolase